MDIIKIKGRAVLLKYEESKWNITNAKKKSM